MTSPLRAREADLSEILARVGVAVKPLEWVGDEAKTPFGRYTVTRTEDGYQAAFEWDEFAHFGFNAVDIHYGARRAARDSAQADYEARILSALRTQETQDDHKL